jgi:hypothetical protein
MDCLLHEVFDARSGGPVVDARMVEAPVWIGAPGAPRAMGKGVYGAPRAYHVDGGNFTVQWDDPEVDSARADAILARLEAAWETLVEVDGWPAPVSSDAWLLWVNLDPTLAGSGYTVEYTDDTYPDGYPVMWLNPNYEAENPAFGLSVAVHEFGHALQYGVRTPGDRTDAWFWEATSEWTAEHAAPDLDTYAESAWWYAQYPEAAWDAPDRYHPYGMLLLNAWLDERIFGFDGIVDLWVGGEGIPWAERIPAVAGAPLDELLPEMAAEVAAGTLRESALYEPPVHLTVSEGWQTVELPGLYGSYYVDWEGPLTVEGPVAVRYISEGVVSSVQPEGAYIAVFTATGEGDLSFGVPPVTAEPCGCAGAEPPMSWLILPMLLPLRRRVV